jgi:hypothetical protein
VTRILDDLGRPSRPHHPRSLTTGHCGRTPGHPKPRSEW